MSRADQMENRGKTRAWQLYELGRSYNERLSPSQYTLVETNTEFFIGNQWLRLPNTPAMRGLPKPVFNILKRVASLFIASLTSSATTLHVEPLAYYDGSNRTDPDHDAVRFANAELDSLLEKFKFEYRLRDALFDGAASGDYCAHFWFDPEALPYGDAFGDGESRGEIRMELVDGVNVLFGNPNDRRVQEQPYLLVVGRDTVGRLREEAERSRKNGTGGEPERVSSDNENDRMPGGGRIESGDEGDSGKAPKGEKEEPYLDAQGVRRSRRVETVYVTKATRGAVIYKDVDTGLSLYPLAWGNWEKQKNQYHGRALVTGLLPNQIFINSLFATAMRHMQLMAFPKTVYNADLISAWDNEIGQAIGVHGLQPGSGVGDVAANLSPAEMSGQIFALIDKVMAYTKECLGATDAQMGNVKPDNTSALMVLQTNAEVPLENIRANLYEWVEDIGAILLDMMGTYYGLRKVVVERTLSEPVIGPDGLPALDGTTGQMRTREERRRVVEEFDFSQFKRLWLNLRVDVGATSYFSEIAMTQTLDNLRREGALDLIQYLERLPDRMIPKKEQLLEELRNRAATMEDAGTPGAGETDTARTGPARPGGAGTNAAPTGAVAAGAIGTGQDRREMRT